MCVWYPLQIQGVHPGGRLCPRLNMHPLVPPRGEKESAAPWWVLPPEKCTFLSCENRVQCRYNAVSFLQNPNRHPIAHQWGQALGCLCENRFWFMFCLNCCSGVCYIMIRDRLIMTKDYTKKNTTAWHIYETGKISFRGVDLNCSSRVTFRYMQALWCFREYNSRWLQAIGHTEDWICWR